MAKLHSASPREITSPFTHEIISVLHSKACNNLYIFHSYSCNKLYLYMSSKKIVIERIGVLIYLKFVVTDFSPKITSPSTGENSGDAA